MPTTKKNNLLEYKGHPLMRKENIIYYGSMSDSHIIMMQILESGDYKGLPVAKRVSVQLQQTDPNVRMKERIVISNVVALLSLISVTRTCRSVYFSRANMPRASTAPRKATTI